ncbi:MAG: 23S rRNA (adenine(2030)-N(6))-methyltransferase RlmJ [Gammaproteobacteria bacterium]|nr:23S rRNA (adenine(2030)-N(6))-methyltransferase RlmJ [Gammaproteobacteria bacterium]
MIYRHVQYAANRADLIKHLALLCLEQGSSTLRVWDAFAAMPCYPLHDLDEDRRQLLFSLMGRRGPRSLSSWQRAVAECHDPQGQPAYPGSGWLLSRLPSVEAILLSDQDEACVRALEHWFKSDGHIHVHQMDSFQEDRVWLSFQPQLVLIDPPFLSQEEWSGVQGLLTKIRRNCTKSASILWYPLRNDLTPPRDLSCPGDSSLLVDFEPSRGMNGCVLHFSGLEDSCLDELKSLCDWLSQVDELRIANVQLLEFSHASSV